MFFKKYFYWLIIVIFIFFAYFRLTQAYLTLGDNVIVYNNIKTYNPLHWFVSEWLGVGHGYYRPLQVISLYPFFHLFSLNPLPYGLLQIFLLSTASIMLFELLRLRLFLKTPALAFLITALFPFSVPVTCSILFLTDNSSLYQAIILIGITNLLWTKEIFSSRDLYLVLLPLITVSMFLKESGVVIGGCVVAYIFCLSKEKKKIVKFCGVMVLMVFIYLFLRNMALKGVEVSLTKASEFGLILQNILVAFLTTFVPILGPKRDILKFSLYGWVGMVCYTVLFLIVILYLSKRSRQKISIFLCSVILGMSLLSFSEVNYRIGFLPILAYVVLVGLAIWEFRKISFSKKSFIYGCIIGIFIWSFQRAISTMKNYLSLTRDRKTLDYVLKDYLVAKHYKINPGIEKEFLQFYFPADETETIK